MMRTKEEILKIIENTRWRWDIIPALLKSFNRKDLKIAEIGIWDSTNMKRVLEDCGDIISQYWAIDFWQPSNHSSYVDVPMEKWDELYAYACKFMRWYPQLCVVRMSSLEAARLFPEKYFDIVFIDADHKYESVMANIKTWSPLIKEGGLIMGHDRNKHHPGVVKAITECFDGIIKARDSVWIKEL